jgi:endonuclease/exonuclease/phosphatase family metal-dependent hydrolase
MTQRDVGRAGARRAPLALLTIFVLAALCGCSTGHPRDLASPATVLRSRHVIEGEPPVSASPPGSITFGSYNIHWLDDPSGVRADLARLDSVSVWAFQEARSSAADRNDGSPSRVVEVLPPGTWHLAWVPLNRLTEIHSEDDEGQVIASRCPIRSAEVWELKTDGDKRRVALVAVLDVDGRAVRFVNTDHEPSIVSLARGNVRQTGSLIEALGRCEAADPMPTVVGGDFNTSGCLMRLVSGNADCAELRQRMNATGFDEAFVRKVGARTYRSSVYSGTLDHLFVRRASTLASGVDERATGSDHLPVWCRIDVYGMPNAPAGGTSAVAGTVKPTR